MSSYIHIYLFIYLGPAVVLRIECFLMAVPRTGPREGPGRGTRDPAGESDVDVVQWLEPVIVMD